MEVISSVAHMKQWSRSRLVEGKSIGFVPTMGFLHEGHLSLMRRARLENALVVVSIFVNPTQFGANEDYASYPRDPKNDLKKCQTAGVDAVLVPSAEEIYPPGAQTFVTVEKISTPLCGASRPGHFRGVATIVLKLFNIVGPTRAYFGEKDYQQLQVIRTMVRDLNVDVEIVACPTVRESDGLAMSSRNSYLSPAERRQAVCLCEALREAESLVEHGETTSQRLIQAMSSRIRREPDANIDYVRVVHPETLEDVDIVRGKALAALAVRIGRTRLIDNRILQTSLSGSWNPPA